MQKSTLAFWFSALILLIFGILYLVWPIAPYHEEIIGLSSEELASRYPEIAKLMMTLVNIAGLSFVSLGILTLGLGVLAWQNRVAWLSFLVILIVFAAPLTYVTAITGGPYLVIFIPVFFQIIGLLLAHQKK